MDFIRLPLGFGQMNCYLLFNENKEGIVIDPGYDFEIIDREVEKRNLDLKYILLTHSHGDHIGAVEELKEKYPKAKLGIHEDEVDMLKDSRLNLSAMIQGRDIILEPDFTFKDNDIIELGNEKIKVIHTPGHSPGGSCFYIDDILFCGDTLFKESIGRSDFYMGDLRTLLNSIQNRIFTLDDETVIYPGHGPETSVAYEKRRNPFLK